MPTRKPPPGDGPRLGTLHRLSDFVRHVAKSAPVGVAISVVGVILVAFQWRSVDWTAVRAIPVERLAAASVAYALALLALAGVAATGDVLRRKFGAGLAAQLAKYIPGGLWQAQPLYAGGGLSSVGAYGAAVVVAAGLCLLPSGSAILAGVGAGALSLASLMVVRLGGAAKAGRVLGLALVIAVGIAASGAVLAGSVGLPASSGATQIAGAWGLGVLVLPVPAGIGVRELYLSFAEAGDAGASLAVAHRVVTLFVDVVVGGIGLVMVRGARTGTDSLSDDVPDG